MVKGVRASEGHLQQRIVSSACGPALQTHPALLLSNIFQVNLDEFRITEGFRPNVPAANPQAAQPSHSLLPAPLPASILPLIRVDSLLLMTSKMTFRSRLGKSLPCADDAGDAILEIRDINTNSIALWAAWS